MIQLIQILVKNDEFERKNWFIDRRKSFGSLQEILCKEKEEEKKYRLFLGSEEIVITYITFFYSIIIRIVSMLLAIFFFSFENWHHLIIQRLLNELYLKINSINSIINVYSFT